MTPEKSPIILTPPPPPPPPPPVEKAALAFPWWRKWSTWLALTATAVGAYCGASLAAYAMAPDAARAAITAGELAWYARGAMVSAGITALIPIATSIRQKTP